MISEADIRRGMIASLSARHLLGPNRVVLEEMPVGRGSARVDIAVVSNMVAGYELKSEADSLSRLQRQATFYNRAFDEMTLVTTSSHLESAMHLIPEWWAVMIANVTKPASLEINTFRPGRTNPVVLITGYLKFLERCELIALLDIHNKAKGMRSARWSELASHIRTNLSDEDIAAGVRRQLLQRGIVASKVGHAGNSRLICGCN